MLSNTIKWKLELQWTGERQLLIGKMERQRDAGFCICFPQQEYYISIFCNGSFLIGLCFSISHCDTVHYPMNKQVKPQLWFQNMWFGCHRFDLRWHQLWFKCVVTETFNTVGFKTPSTCSPLLWELPGFTLEERVCNIDTKGGLRWAELYAGEMALPWSVFRWSLLEQYRSSLISKKGGWSHWTEGSYGI